MRDKFLLFIRTVRFLSPWQVLWRLRFVCLRRYWRLSKRAAPLVKERVSLKANWKPLWNCSADLLGAVSPATFSEALAAYGAVQRGEFTFQSLRVAFESGAPRWHDPEVSQLWRYHLHYFDYVDELIVGAMAGEADQAFAVFRQLALSWIESNPVVAGDAWHPYPLSLRIVNWVNAAGSFREQIANAEEFGTRFVASLSGQVEVLAQTLEFDVRGNHLLKNLKALIWAGLVIEHPSSERWFARGMEILERELAEQVLEDGGHFERSAGYHLLVLRDCLETAIWLERHGRSSPKWLDDAICRMATYLWQVRRPDGRIPLFKDAAWDQSLISEDELLAACAFRLESTGLKPDLPLGEAAYVILLYGSECLDFLKEPPEVVSEPGSVWLPVSGFGVARGDRSGDYLIMDVGKPCPDYLPAHAHADLLSFELCVGERSIVVDSGVYQYAPGPWRDFFRSTRAHNTVVVDGQSQSEVWGSFRVARRARPIDLHFEETGSAVVLEGGHDGYRRLSNNVMHRRRIIAMKQGCWVVLDWLVGSDAFEASSYLHFHPSLRPLDGGAWGDDEGAVVWLTPICGDQASIVRGEKQPEIQGFHSGRFGELQSNAVCCFEQDIELSGFLGYVISKSPIDIDGIEVCRDQIAFSIADENEQVALRWNVAS